MVLFAAIAGDMTLATILDFATLFFSGILAGMEIVIHFGLRSPAELLSEQSQIQLRQALILRLRVLVPACFLPMTASGIAGAVLAAGLPGFWLRCASMLAIVLWVLIRIVGTVPINSATLTWKADSPPDNWKALVNKAERFHILGVWAAIAAFVSFLTAVGSLRNI